MATGKVLVLVYKDEEHKILGRGLAEHLERQGFVSIIAQVYRTASGKTYYRA